MRRRGCDGGREEEEEEASQPAPAFIQLSTRNIQLLWEHFSDSRTRASSRFTPFSILILLLTWRHPVPRLSFFVPFAPPPYIRRRASSSLCVPASSHRPRATNENFYVRLPYAYVSLAREVDGNLTADAKCPASQLQLEIPPPRI